MKPLTSNILYLAIIGLLIISVGSLTYTLSSKNETVNKNPTNTGTQTTKNTPKDLDDDIEDADDSPNPTTPAPSSQNTTTSTTKSYTAGDVASHNNQSSCWTIVNGNVYDVTSYINSHPGGQRAIESICGVNGTGAFDNQHSGASKPERVLQSFLIGPLK